MSRVKELADAEADRAEAEDDEADPLDPDGEPDLDPDDPDPDEPELSLDARMRAFERECTRHLEAIADVLGDDAAGYEPCEACGAAGVRPAEALVYDPDLERCPHCRGHGVMLTGAQREDRIARECLACQGNGYRQKAQEAAQPSQPAAPGFSFDPYTGQPIASGSTPAPPTLPGGAGWAPGYEPPAQSLPAGVR